MFQDFQELIKKYFQEADSSSEKSFTEPDYDFLSSTFLSDCWKKIGKKRRAGIRVPLFFIYTRKSAGIGEIPDLKLMIDWCVKTGSSILELLPLNDVGFSFSPYSSESSFALDPMYLSLQDMVSIKGNLQKEAIGLKTRFPLSSKVDYGIKGEKLKTLWNVFLTQAEFPSQLKEFVEANSFWLEDYCLFRVLKDLQQQREWKDWEERFRDRDEESLQEIKTRHKNSIKFYQWLQWQLYSQLKSVKDYADSRDVLLKGDLPWMVNRDSADVWAYREKYFDLEFAAGAPPDMFSAEGQRWGMPPLKWNNIFADDFSYIAKKLQLAQNFYHLFRIDHVVGLFRMWKIPLYIPPEEKGTKGSFEPKERDDWERQGRKILKAIIKSTSMLPCAEDLGSVPFFCYDILKELGIPGIRVQRWNKKDLGSKEFKDPKDYARLTISTLSTHDTSNWLEWWNKEASNQKKKNLLKVVFEGNVPLFLSLEKLITKNLESINKASSIFCILMLTEWLFLDSFLDRDKPSDYRFNIPGIISDENWSLRMPAPLEELLEQPFNQKIRKIISKTKRTPQS